jgi:predicted outer membrane protein
MRLSSSLTRAPLLLLASLTVAAQPQGADAEFLERIGSIRQAQIDVGQLARHKGASAEVQQLGREEERQQRAALDRLQAVGVEQDFWMEPRLQDPEVQLYKQLDDLDGERFDEAYLRQRDATRAELTRLLSEEARWGHDGALRAHAADELLRMAAAP